ncbi:F-actin binding protein regulates actin cytoskeletal organization protein [Dioscorea alata]|uniref:F-actin binding protein regulates actin cytoskeletal organization protein n=1 Tax=Dioscorea alata TaxID=55571 RepID=A0ACB7UQG0_DIOAL|nr:F-actin binding protein regulates actin cytoskeletal organization protein [Dioscorea alata]
MFKAGRWRSEKNKIKAVFKFQFHATQVLELGWEAMVVSLVPVDVGRPTLRSEKGEVVNGVCHWSKPIWETVKFIQDPKSGKINEKAYQFLVSAAGSTKAGYLGETTINLADYADVFKPSSVSLPLKGSNTAAILHVTIQRMQGDEERRVTDEHGAMIVGHQRKTLQTQLSNEKDEIGKLAYDVDVRNSPKESLFIDSPAEKKFQSSRNMVCHSDFKKSNGPDVISRSCSDTSSGQYSPKLNGVFNSNSQQDSVTLLSPLCNSDTPRNAIASSIEWSVTSGPDGKMDGSTNSSGEAGLRERLYDPDITLEKLRSDAITLVRQLDISELELQTLRKQVVKESKRGQDHLREISSLKEERDTLRRECEELKNMQKRTINLNESQKMCFDGEDLRSMLEEIKEELSHEKKLNANLQLQLQKTKESNSELILAVRDLDELLEQKNRESSSVDNAKVGLSREIYENYQDNGDNSPQLKNCKQNQEFLETMVQRHDEEQYALEVLVKEHDVGVKHSLEQQIVSLKSEVDLYQKDREELEMQMEQLALDYEILKQENHEISSKLEQIQLREQLRMQYECSAHLSIINDLEFHIEGLEKNLEEQAEAFEADLETITRAKVEQEQRAIQAEEALRNSRRSSANTAEKLQEDFKRLSTQVSSTFYANEKLAIKAMTEANDLRLEKFNLEELLWKSNEELMLVKDQYHVKLQQLSNLFDMKTKETSKLLQEVESKSAAVDNQRKYNEALKRAFLEELVALRVDVERLEKEKIHHSELVQQKEKLVGKMEQLKSALEDSEMMAHNRNINGGLLEQEIISYTEETNKSLELKDSSHLGHEDETMINKLNSEVETLKVRSADLGYPFPADQVEKENLRNEVLYLTGELQNVENMDGYITKKLEDSDTRIAVFDGATKTIVDKKNAKSGLPPHNNKEVGALQEKYRLLQQEIELKDAKLEDTKYSFLEKEDINDAGSREKMVCCKGTGDKVEDVSIDGKNINTINNTEVKYIGGDLLIPRLGDKAFMLSPSTFNRLLYMSITKDGSEREESFVAGTCDQGYIAEILSEVAVMKEHNKAMEAELKEMQQRYSAISLKFAEVEGERQQLVMTVRGLKNGSKG